jgi:hypothetical protein
MALEGPLGAIECIFRIKMQHEDAARPTRQRGLKMYERALVIACPILPLFAHHLRQFGRTKCNVPITRKPQVADPELGLAPLVKEGNGDDGREGADRPFVSEMRYG